MKSESAAASCTSCDTTMLVVPNAWLMVRINSTITPLEIGSSPVKGSSYMIIIGSSAMARASATRRAMPPDNSLGMRSRAPRKPTACNFINTRSRIMASGSSVCSRSGKATLSNTSRSVSSAPLWNIMPMRLRSSYSSPRRSACTSRPSTCTRPALGRNWPPINFSNVVLPVPLGPMMAVILPRAMSLSMPSKITRGPRAKRRPRISIRDGCSRTCDMMVTVLLIIGSAAAGHGTSITRMAFQCHAAAVMRQSAAIRTATGAPMAYFTKRYHPPGTPPGTLVEHAAAARGPLRLRLIAYTADRVEERDNVSALQCKDSLARDDITWIDAHGRITPEVLQELGTTFGLHPLTLEDVLNTGQRPKLEGYDHQLFIIMSLPVWRDEGLTTEQISVFVGERYLISFHNGDDDIFEPVRKRLHSANGRMRAHGADYLLYSLLDLVIDQGFPILEALGERIEELDQLLREEQALIGAHTKPYLRDCYDHTVQIMDLFETYRDMTSSMLDVYISSVSQRLNDIMRVLTIIATLFIPPTFLVGVYGMNFGDPHNPWAMPELYWRYGYPQVWAMIIAMIGGMLVYFKRHGWF